MARGVNNLAAMLANIRARLLDLEKRWESWRNGGRMFGRLELPGDPDVSATGGGSLQLGEFGAGKGLSMHLDSNEIQAFNNGVANDLNLNVAAGGKTNFGGDLQLTGSGPGLVQWPNVEGRKLNLWGTSYGLGISAYTLDIVTGRYVKIRRATTGKDFLFDTEHGNATMPGHIVMGSIDVSGHAYLGADTYVSSDGDLVGTGGNWAFYSNGNSHVRSTSDYAFQLLARSDSHRPFICGYGGQNHGNRKWYLGYPTPNDGSVYFRADVGWNNIEAARGLAMRAGSGHPIVLQSGTPQGGGLPHINREDGTFVGNLSCVDVIGSRVPNDIDISGTTWVPIPNSDLSTVTLSRPAKAFATYTFDVASLNGHWGVMAGRLFFRKIGASTSAWVDVPGHPEALFEPQQQSVRMTVSNSQVIDLESGYRYEFRLYVRISYGPLSARIHHNQTGIKMLVAK